MWYFGFSLALPGGGSAPAIAVTRRDVLIWKTAIQGNGEGCRWRHRHEGGGVETPDRRTPFPIKYHTPVRAGCQLAAVPGLKAFRQDAKAGKKVIRVFSAFLAR